MHHHSISRCWGWNSELCACEANKTNGATFPAPSNIFFRNIFHRLHTKLMELTWQSGLLIAEMGSVDRVTICMILGLSKRPPTSRSVWKSLQRPCSVQTRLEEKSRELLKRDGVEMTENEANGARWAVDSGKSQTHVNNKALLLCWKISTVR